MSAYDERPWLALYADGQPPEIAPRFANALEMFSATVARTPDTDAIRYFDGRITFAELDALSGAFAAGLLDAGLQRGDRVALYLQNVPQFVIAQLGTWKAGGVAVSANPMYRQRELAELLADCGAVALVCLESLYRDVAAAVLAGTEVRLVLTTSELEHQSTVDPRALAGSERIDVAGPGVSDLAAMLAQHHGQKPPPPGLRGENVAFLTYTSGTTGPPKGAMTTHANVVFNAQTYCEWMRIDREDVVLGVAPLFHITGLVADIAVSLRSGAPLVLMHRFDPALTLETVRAQRATFTVASITVFIALMNVEGAEREDLASLSKIYSGGAPIAPSTVDAFERRFGHYIHNIYGLTETTSPSHAVPFGSRAPVDPASGALSVGVPVYNTVVRVVDEQGGALPPGEVGEIEIGGPQVAAGYWGKPRESAHAFPGGVLRTGDVGYMSPEGWFFIVDRKKDLINAGGYKVWPREVEDVLYEHSGVREAAVVGVADPYRGETVKAFVSLVAGAQTTPQELIAFCRERLAAYKYPRQVEILAEIPKTVTGKALRRELRARSSYREGEAPWSSDS